MQVVFRKTEDLPRCFYDNERGIVGEDMPQESNRVTLDPDVKDKNGIPIEASLDQHAEPVDAQPEVHRILAQRDRDGPSRRRRHRRYRR